MTTPDTIRLVYRGTAPCWGTAITGKPDHWLPGDSQAVPAADALLYLQASPNWSVLHSPADDIERVPVTAAQLAVMTAGEPGVVYELAEPPYTWYRWDGVAMVVVGSGNGASVTAPAVQAVLQSDQPGGRAALGLGSAATHAAGDFAPLVDGKLPAANLPDIALQQYGGAVASQAAMLAVQINGQPPQLGDWVTRSDTGTDWRVIGDPSTLAGWLQTSYPSAPISSVNGKAGGAVTLTPADVGAMPNTIDAIQAVIDAAKAGDASAQAKLATLQSSVSDAMPRLLPSSPGTTILDFSAGPSIATSVAASACTVAWNPTGWHDGTGCLELTPTTDSYSNFALYFDSTKQFSLFSDDGYAIEHDLPNVEDKAANPIASLRIGTGATSTTQPANCREVRLFAQATGIVYFSGPRYDRHRWDFANTDAKCGVYPGYNPGINGAGVASTDNINWVRFEFFGVAGKKYKIKRLVRGGSARACIVMGTDSAAFDPLTELVNAQMAKYGWRWSINQYFGGGNGVDDLAISRRNISAIYKAGSDYNLNDLVDRPLATAGLTAAQVEAMARECVTKAHGYGWYRGSDIHIYNNNSHNDTVVQGLRQAGIIAARGGQSDGRFVFAEGGVVNPLRIPSASWDERTTAQMTAQVDRTIEYGATAWVYWHNVFSRAKVVADGQPAVGALTPSAYRATNLVYANNRGIDQYTVWWEELQGTLAYIKAKEMAGQIIVMSPSEWCAAIGIR